MWHPTVTKYHESSIICTCNSSNGSALSKVYPEAAVHPRFYLPTKFMKLSWPGPHMGNRPTETHACGENPSIEKWIRERWSSRERRAYFINTKVGVMMGYTIPGTIYWRCPLCDAHKGKKNNYFDSFISQEWAQIVNNGCIPINTSVKALARRLDGDHQNPEIDKVPIQFLMYLQQSYRQFMVRNSKLKHTWAYIYIFSDSQVFWIKVVC